MNAPAAGGRRVLVPDLEGTPVHTLGVLEEVLMAIAGWQDEEDDPGLPAALCGTGALEAVRRLYAALKPTQDIGVSQGRLLAPLGVHRAGMPAVGHYEHNPLTEITVDAGDVLVLAAIAAELGRPGLDSDVVDVIEGLAPAGGYGRRLGPWRAEFVVQLAGLAGLLDLAWTEDAELIAARAQERARGSDVFLTDDEEAAYQRLADRFNAITSGDGIQRWLY